MEDFFIFRLLRYYRDHSLRAGDGHRGGDVFEDGRVDDAGGSGGGWHSLEVQPHRLHPEHAEKTQQDKGDLGCQEKYIFRSFTNIMKTQRQCKQRYVFERSYLNHPCRSFQSLLLDHFKEDNVEESSRCQTLKGDLLH